MHAYDDFVWLPHIASCIIKPNAGLLQYNYKPYIHVNLPKHIDYIAKL